MQTTSQELKPSQQFLSIMEDILGEDNMDTLSPSLVRLLDNLSHQLSMEYYNLTDRLYDKVNTELHMVIFTVNSMIANAYMVAERLRVLLNQQSLEIANSDDIEIEFSPILQIDSVVLMINITK